MCLHDIHQHLIFSNNRKELNPRTPFDNLFSLFEKLFLLGKKKNKTTSPHIPLILSPVN